MFSNYLAAFDSDLIHPSYYDENRLFPSPEYKQEIINFLNNWVQELSARKGNEKDKKSFMEDLEKLIKELNSDYNINPKKKFYFFPKNSGKKNLFFFSTIIIYSTVLTKLSQEILLFSFPISLSFSFPIVLTIIFLAVLIPMVILSFLVPVYTYLNQAFSRPSPSKLALQDLINKMDKHPLFSEGPRTRIKSCEAFFSHLLGVLHANLTEKSQKLENSAVPDNFLNSLQGPKKHSEYWEKINLHKRTYELTVNPPINDNTVPVF